MTIAEDKAKYFWLAANDEVTETEPEPATFDQSLVTPCIDLEEYVAKLEAALALVGVSTDPAQNKGDFIFIAGWWLGLLGGPFEVHRTDGSLGKVIDDQGDAGGRSAYTPFDLDPRAPERRLIDVLKEKARRGVEIRTAAWVAWSANSLWLFPLPFIGRALDNWLAHKVQTGDAEQYIGINAQSMNATASLRAEPKIGANAILSMVGHSAGSVHLKMCVIGTKPNAAGKSKCIAFTGGLDLVEDRWARQGHPIQPDDWDHVPPHDLWHDIQAAVEGKGAQGVYDVYRRMYNESITRFNEAFAFDNKKIQPHFETTTPIEARSVELPLLSTATPLTHHVQSLSTVPEFNYLVFNCLPEGEKASFAEDGLFEIKAAWKKAILNAEHYIYIEDQLFLGREVMEWINESVQAHPNLKVIFSFSGQGDPNDQAPIRQAHYHESINLGLLGIAPDPDQGETPGPSTPLPASARDRIRLFRHWGDAQPLIERGTFDPIQIAILAVAPIDEDTVLVETNIPAFENVPKDAFLRTTNISAFFDGTSRWTIVGNNAATKGTLMQFVVRTTESGVPAPGSYQILHLVGTVMHAKITLIDDKWALIGSCNHQRRSLYTDWEHSVSFMDEAGTAVRDFRAKLWAEHFRSSPTEFLDLTTALGAWEPAWNPAGGSPPHPQRPPGNPFGRPYLDPIPLVGGFPIRPMTEEEREKFDMWDQVDSREAWGGFCVVVKELF